MSFISPKELGILLGVVGIITAYHFYLFIRVRRNPMGTAIGLNAHTRRLWVKEVMQEKRDILAIQTLRNQVMAATFLASTSILICLGLLGATFRPGVFSEISHALNLVGTKNEALWMFKLMLLIVLFFFTFFNFTLSIRYYNHAGFMINTFDTNDPVLSVENVAEVLDHAAIHYTFGMRGFYLSVPTILWLFGPFWMLMGCLVMIGILYRLDREA